MPVAGKGTRLRPHTHLTPKPLLRVGDKPVLSYILDDLRELGVNEAVLITGHLKEKVEAFMTAEYPDFHAVYTEQVEQRGTADAIRLAEPFVQEEMLIIFVDTLFDADLSLVKRLPEDVAGVIWAKEVEDYQRFGVIVTDEDGFMKQIIEKPTEPVSKLANIGLYYIRDWKLLFEGIRHVMKQPARRLRRVLPDGRLSVHGGQGRQAAGGARAGLVRRGQARHAAGDQPARAEHLPRPQPPRPWATA